MFNWLKRRKWLMVSVVLIAVLLSQLGIQVADKGTIDQSVKIGVGNSEMVITLGHVTYAAGSVDYTYDGTDDNVQFQAALNALPATGGRLVDVSAVQKNFSATVTRAIANVIITGAGAGSYFTNDGVTALFTAGGNGWQFESLRTDAGGINMGATTGWVWLKVNNGTSNYDLRTPAGSLINGTFVASSITDSGLTLGRVTRAGPSGLLGDSSNLTFDGTSLQVSGANVTRTATYVVAASNAPAQVKAQADYAEINAAIAALTSGRTWVETVKCIGGFTPAASIDLPSYTQLDLTEASFTWAVDDVLFTTSGAVSATSQALTVNAALGDTSVTVADSSGFAVGDYVRISSTNESNPAYANDDGEIHRVLSVPDGATINIQGTLWDDYVVADTATVAKMNMVVSPSIVGGIIIGDSATANSRTGLQFDFAADFKVIGLKTINLGYRATAFQGCIDGDIDVSVYGSAKAGSGYGISLYSGCQNLDIYSSDLRYCRHALTIGSGDVNIGITRFINFHHNFVEYTTDGAIDDHGCGEDISIDYNYINTTDKAVYMGSRRWSAKGNVIPSASYGFVTRGDWCEEIRLEGNILGENVNTGTYFNSTALTRVVIDGMDALNSSTLYYVVGILGTATTNVDLNNITTTGLAGTIDADLLYVDAGVVNLRNSTLKGGGRLGAHLKDVTGGSVIGCDIKDNNQKGSALAIRSAGLYLENCSGLLVQNDSFTDDQGVPTQKYGIYEDATSDNNTFRLNKFSGNTTSPIVKSGASSIVSLNIGYATENSDTATILNGNISVSVLHGLTGTPTNIQLTGKHAEVADVYAISENSTHFQIWATANVTANRDMFWIAKIE